MCWNRRDQQGAGFGLRVALDGGLECAGLGQGRWEHKQGVLAVPEQVNGLVSAGSRAGAQVCSPAQVALGQRAPGQDGWECAVAVPDTDP